MTVIPDFLKGTENTLKFNKLQMFIAINHVRRWYKMPGVVYYDSRS